MSTNTCFCPVTIVKVLNGGLGRIFGDKDQRDVDGYTNQDFSRQKLSVLDSLRCR